MRAAEDVTFGSSSLDRAAHLRKDPSALDTHPEATTIVLWRGKPLVSGDPARLTHLPLDHPVLECSERPPLFLGLDGKKPVFATDISPWEAPDTDTEAMTDFFDTSINRHSGLAEDQIFQELRGLMAILNPADGNAAATARGIFAWHDSHPYCARCGAPSEIVSAGWQRRCKSCGADHFPRTDPVVIVLVTHNNNLLLGRSPNWPEGMYSLLAGFVEPGEGIEAASRREVFEEAGIKLGPVSYLASQPWPFPSSLMFGTRGEALNTEIDLDPVELDAAAWFTREDVANAMDGENPAFRPARKGSIAHFLIDHWLKDDLG